MKTIRQITEEIRKYDGWYCNLLNTIFDVEDESETAVYTAERLEDILDSDEFVEAKGNAYQNQILIDALKEDTMKYTIEYTDPTTGATSPIDTIEAPKGYTAEQYIRDCEENADQEWIDMIHAGEITVVWF